MSDNLEPARARALIERLIAAAPDAAVRHRLVKMRRRMKLPMAKVLERIPGTVIQQAARVGVTRQTIYFWLNGETRPGPKKAKLLARLTGYDAAAIRGLVDDEPYEPR